MSGGSRNDHDWNDAFEYREWQIDVSIVYDGRLFVGGFVAVKGVARCSDFSMFGYLTAQDAKAKIGEKAVRAVDAAIAATDLRPLPP